MLSHRNLISSLLMFSLFVSSLTGPYAFAKTDDNAAATSQRDETESTAQEGHGLRFRLSAGVDQPESRPTTKQAQATELSQNETESILKRLPPMQVEGEDEQAFRLPERSLPPPRTGQTINVSFPAATSPTSSTMSPPEAASGAPLVVLRYAPEGDVPLAPQLSVTFSQPMIVMSSQEEAAYGSRSYGFGWWMWRTVWFDHQNLRDERSEAFTSLLWEGVYNYSYVSRATTPGLFVVPPTKAEEMYHPETFGRSRTDRVRIE